MRATEVDHRLHGEEHTWFEHYAFAGPADMHDVGLVVEQAAKPVAAEVTHHAHVLAFNESLDGRANVSGGRAGAHRRDAAHHGFIRDFNESLCPARDVADRVHPARIAMPAVKDERHVNVDDIAFLQRLFV